MRERSRSISNALSSSIESRSIRSHLAWQVERDAGDDDLREGSQRMAQPCRRLIVQDAVSPASHDDLREDYGQREVGALSVQR